MTIKSLIVVGCFVFVSSVSFAGLKVPVKAPAPVIPTAEQAQMMTMGTAAFVKKKEAEDVAKFKPICEEGNKSACEALQMMCKNGAKAACIKVTPKTPAKK